MARLEAALTQQLLALLTALAALALGLAEEPQFVIACAFGLLDVGLQAPLLTHCLVNQMKWPAGMITSLVVRPAADTRRPSDNRQSCRV